MRSKLSLTMVKGSQEGVVGGRIYEDAEESFLGAEVGSTSSSLWEFLVSVGWCRGLHVNQPLQRHHHAHQRKSSVAHSAHTTPLDSQFFWG